MKTNKRLGIALYLGFISLGLVASIIGPIVTAAKNEITMDFSQTGLVISGQFIGALILVLFGGHLADRFGKKLFLIVGSLVLSAGLAGSMLSTSFISLFIWTLLSGIGFGAYEVGINALCSDYTKTNKGNAMNFLHFFFGVGAIFGPIVSTLCINYFSSWRIIFGFVAIFPIIVMFLLLSLNIPKVAPEKASSEPFPFKSPYLWASSILAFFYVGLEVSTYGWLPLYWKEIVSGSIIPPSLIATGFWCALTFGRLFTGRLADKTGLQNFLIYASTFSVLGTLAWAVIPPSTILIVVVVALGLLYAGIFPTNMAAVISKYPGRSGSISSFVTIFSSLGGSLIPSALGKSADIVGIQNMPVIIIFVAVGLFILTLVTKRCYKTMTDH